ncbi:MAG: ATP-binding protein, partial [Thermoproteota archaeon]
YRPWKRCPTSPCHLLKYRVYRTTVSSLMDQLYSTLIDNSTVEMIEGFCRIPLMIIDELGYMNMDIPKANLFFQLISKRYEKGSTIITTNLPFEQWGNVFGQDEVIASAILDRFLHYCHIIPIQGNSYRVKDKIKPKEKLSYETQNGWCQGLSRRLAQNMDGSKFNEKGGSILLDNLQKDIKHCFHNHFHVICSI